MLLRSLGLAVVGLLLCALPASAATTVSVRDDYFQPRLVSVAKGSRVVWVNRGSDPHTITTPAWSVRLAPGQSYGRRIYRGWSYRCRFHDMRGRIACTNC
jgi:plastocyanin